jgi:hypothetical protein
MLLPSFVLNVTSSGTGRSPSLAFAFMARFCCEMGSVFQALTMGRKK